MPRLAFTGFVGTRVEIAVPHGQTGHLHTVSWPADLRPLLVTGPIVHAEIQVPAVGVGRRYTRPVVEAEIESLPLGWIILADQITEDVVQLGFGIQPEGDREVAGAGVERLVVSHFDSSGVSIEVGGSGVCQPLAGGGEIVTHRCSPAEGLCLA